MIYLHTALPAEARPLIDHYRLRAHQRDHAFRLYSGENISLVVSGVGKIATAAAVAYAQAQSATPPGPWLNIGIAGHSRADLGTALIAHKIVDGTTSRVFYPSFSFSPPCDSTPVLSVDQPTETYFPEGAFDMEASAFFETAQRFVPVELVHSIKIISDNPQSNWRDIQRQQIQTWIEQVLPTIDAVKNHLETLLDFWHGRHQQPPHYQNSLERWHFTHSQQHRLRNLLQHWQALGLEHCPWEPEAKDIQRASQALDYLDHRLAAPDLAPF